ncbi:MAG: N-acetylmuramic acid 6-phosphate etherase [Candidatus Marinimicrobia bacterium]|nr:N-acetylmuramic acid 6-phosphate etherase [Candidatus Neomarinimicrobiota bacterium]
MIKRETLKTEQQNENTVAIDQFSIPEVLKMINDEDQTISSTVRESLPEIEKVVNYAKTALVGGGRVFYIGAGTSGRLGVLDASECPPTYSAPSDWFIGIIAGGDKALRNSIEGAEDKQDSAIEDLRKFDITDNDLVIGISCSGAAKYVISALDYAKGKGSKTAYLITNPVPFLTTDVDVVISVDTGPEIITGSTRMKAGTATKMVLNMISTATMVSMGKVYGNLMVDLMAVNEKLVDRGTRIIQKITGLDYVSSEKALIRANKSVKTAIVMITKNCELNDAEEKLRNVGGSLRKVIDA